MYARFYRWATDRIDKNGVLAFVTNRSFIDSRTFDGFRKIIASEFNHIYIIDLGGDVRSNPKLSGPKHNVFSIQTGVAIMILVKDNNNFEAKSEQEFENIKKEHNMVEEPTATYESRTAYGQGCRIQYYRRPEEELAIDKLQFLNDAKIEDLAFEVIHPDKNNNWVNLSDDNDWESLIPIADNKNSFTIFKKMSMGVVTARDEWVYSYKNKELEKKMKFFTSEYNNSIKNNEDIPSIKWSDTLKKNFQLKKASKFDKNKIVTAFYKPFIKKYFLIVRF